MTRRIAFINEKGGSLKTTLTVNVGGYFALTRKERVLLVDLDPQGHAGKCLGLDVRGAERTVRDLLVDPSLHPRDVAMPTRIDGLDVIVSNKSLTTLPISSDADRDWTERLARQIDKVRGYDWILFDSPPSLGLLSMNVLLATLEVVIPVNLTFLALDGCAEIVDTIESLKQRYHRPHLRITLVVPTLYRPTRLANEILEKLGEHFRGRVAKTVIGYNVKIDEAQSHGLTIFEYAPDSAGADAFASLAKEIKRKGES